MRKTKPDLTVAILSMFVLTRCSSDVGDLGFSFTDVPEIETLESPRAFATCIGGDCDDTVCLTPSAASCSLRVDTQVALIDRDFDSETATPQNRFEFTTLSGERICMQVTARPSSPTALAEIGGTFTVDEACYP